SEHIGQVDVLDLSHGSDRRGPEARLYWTNGASYARDRLTVLQPSAGFDDLDERAYDVIVFPHSSLFLAGTTGIASLLAKAERALTPGGLIVFTAEVLSGNEPDVDHLDAGLLGGDGLFARIVAETGFVLEGGLDPLLLARL